MISSTKPQSMTLDDLVRRAAAFDPSRRVIVAIAGAPASGKSTLAELLVTRLNETAPGCAALLPMDGYHYDDRVLNERGLRARKGAPDTFDVLGLLHMLGRLKSNQEDEIAVPVFDRDLEIARAGARMIRSGARVLIVEGNYLLLDQQPWSRLSAMFDVTVMVDAPEELLRKRLVERWRGYELAPAEVDAKVEGNDLPNGRYVVTNSKPADFVLSAQGPET
jgi:pantothenate kinase